jgi:hypothetical protein
MSYGMGDRGGRVARSPTLVFRGLEGLVPATSYLHV